MNTRLTGTEPGLAALWNFDDPQNPGKDATTNDFHGKLVKGAKTVEMKLPTEPLADQNKVLDLDGSDGTYVELPPNMINQLTNMTVEAWVQWRSIGFWSRFFDFGKANQRSFNVTQFERTRDSNWKPGLLETQFTLQSRSTLCDPINGSILRFPPPLRGARCTSMGCWRRPTTTPPVSPHQYR